MIFVARILYENQRKEARQYPLHALVCAMVDDQLGKTDLRFALGVVDGIPRHGKDNVLRDCRERVERMFAGLPPRRRFALIDGDKLAGALALDAGADLDAIRQALARNYPDVQMFTPDADHRRDSNTEAIVTAAAGCLGLARTDELFVAALAKEPVARDRLFARTAIAPRHVRDQLRAQQPSLARLADAVAAIVRG